MRHQIWFRLSLTVALALLAATFSAISQPLTSAAAASRPVADPAIGPHARDDAAHRGQVFHFAPARTAIIPRQAKAPTLPSPRGAGNFAAPGAGGNSAAPSASSPSAGVLQREVLGFATYWEIANNATWNYSLLSTVAYFGLDVNGDGSFATNTSGWTGWNSQNLVDTINRAHGAGDRAVVVIKAFDNATICSITYNSAQTTINNTINAIRSKSLDGVNVDFEGSNTTCPNGQSLQNGLSSFVGQLSSQVHQAFPASYVTIDTYSGSASWDSGEFNISQLAPEVDGLFVMAYDMASGNMSGQAGPNAPLNGWTYNDTTAVSQYVSKAPSWKVILGVPYYGYKWSTTSNQPYASIVSGSGAQSDTYSGALDDLNCAGTHSLQLTRSWDGTAQSPWASWYSPATNDPCGGNHGSWRELYYDDATSLGYKYDLVNSSGLQGTGMWALGYDGTSQDLWDELAVKFVSAWPGQYHPLTPARILDTRAGLGYPAALGGNQSLDLQVTGRGGVPPSGVAAVVMNVTATAGQADSFLTVYPTWASRPATSNVNFRAGQTVPNLVEVPLGKGGRVSIYNHSGGVHVVADVQGWVAPVDTSSGNAGRYQSLAAPARLLDTRNAPGTPLGQQSTIDVPVTGQGNLPASGVAAVVLNVTAISPTVGGYLSVFPTGSGVPATSNVNFVAGQTIPNRAIVPVGNNGSVTVFNAWGSTHVVVDVAGWFTDASATVNGGQLSSLAPARILDTRTTLGGHLGPIGAGTTVFSVAGRGGIPAMTDPVPPTAVVLNVTAIDTTASSFLTVYPDGATPPTASDLNWVSGQIEPNLVVARLSPNGTISVYNLAGQTDLLIDVFGYYN